MFDKKEDALRSTEELASMNYYACLGIAGDASLQEIKTRYRKQSLRYHPDKRPPEECRGGFLLIKKAYDCLSDPIKKSEYDEYLASGRPKNQSFLDEMEHWMEMTARAQQEWEEAIKAFAKFEAELTRSNIEAEATIKKIDVAISEAQSAFKDFSNGTYQKKPVKPQSTLKKTEQDYIHQFYMLEQEIDTSFDAQSMTTEETRARNMALQVAKRVVKEMKKLRPVVTNEQGAFILKLDTSEVIWDKELLDSTDICSRIRHGLHFIATGGESFSYDRFDPTNGNSVTTTYNAEVHKESMLYLEHMSKQQHGHGWKKLSNLLLVIAGLMLVAAGILAAIPTGGISLVLAVGGSAALTAGVGFFVRRDTGLANAVDDVTKSLIIKK